MTRASWLKQGNEEKKTRKERKKEERDMSGKIREERIERKSG